MSLPSGGSIGSPQLVTTHNDKDRPDPWDKPPTFHASVSPDTAARVCRIASAVLRALEPCAGPWHVVFRPNKTCVVSCVAIKSVRLTDAMCTTGLNAGGTKAWVEWRPSGLLVCTQFSM
jgi:hypothetical protein